jgi:tRNA 5-methylaminomethyl-2-thiouridine biosynthesis bifunctional protein
MSAARPAWTVLDTAFGDGSAFLNYCNNWRATEDRSWMLHYVGIIEADTLQPWVPALSGLLEGFSSGFQRLVFEQGRISLTLCIGKLKEMLLEQRMQADEVALNSSIAHWDLWTLKALSRCCRRGTSLTLRDGLFPAAVLLRETGFEQTITVPGRPSALRFDPAWNVLRRGTSFKSSPALRSSCAVIGAGLSGASIAHLLAVRGWQVTVLDCNAAPSQGASGLPVGLVAPEVSADDNPRARLSRNGSRLALQYASAMLGNGQDWAPTGVLEREAAGDLWHQRAGWLKPAELVKGWLRHPGIQFRAKQRVQCLRRTASGWTVLGADESVLAQADQVVVANAMGCKELLLQLSADSASERISLPAVNHLQAVFGTMSSGKSLTAAFTETPINGMGSYLPGIPMQQGMQWFAGATFESNEQAIQDVAGQHAANYARLTALVPEVAHALQQEFLTEEVSAWSGVRCVSHDRMPLVGSVLSDPEAGLWIHAAMGAKGLTLSSLCANLLVAQMCSEPWPVEASLANLLAPNRVRRKRN